MRRFGPRPNIPQDTQRRLLEKTEEILQIVDRSARVKRAQQIYESARQTQWFQPVIDGLRGLCGPGELCMYCSSNEPSQLEHFRPVSVFPELAMTYHNYLWSCDICNRTYKQTRFPPDTETGEQILNPLDDNVWDHFFIDEKFGRLLGRVDPSTGELLARASSTLGVAGIGRENVQIKRSRRYVGLRQDAERTLAELEAGSISVAELEIQISEWRSEPFQADVADYFLNGPGREKEPFRKILLATKSLTD